MKRLLQIRILFVLIALLLAPTLVLPFAERLRTEWARYWEPRAEAHDEPQFASSETLRLLADLEQADYQRRVLLARNSSSIADGYESPNLTIIGCKFDALPDEADAANWHDVRPTDAAARQERFLRSLEEVEKTGLPEFDEFDQGPLLSLPTEEYWAELKAREKRRKATKP
jgi:hypothetical protein